jgi:hypothetical protein
MSQSQAMLSQVIGSQSQPPPPQPPPPQPPTPPTPQPKNYFKNIRLILDNIDTKNISLNPSQLSITQEAITILQHPGFFTKKQVEEVYFNLLTLQMQLLQIQPSTSGTPVPSPKPPLSPKSTLKQLEKEELLQQYNKKIQIIEALGTDAQSKLSLFLTTQQELTSKSDFDLIEHTVADLHQFMVNNQYPTYSTAPSSPGSDLNFLYHSP